MEDYMKDLTLLLNGERTPEAIQASLKYMTPLQRSRWQKHIAGMSVSEIAREEGTSVKTVSKSLASAPATVNRKIRKLQAKLNMVTLRG